MFLKKVEDDTSFSRNHKYIRRFYSLATNMSYKDISKSARQAVMPIYTRCWFSVLTRGESEAN